MKYQVQFLRRNNSYVYILFISVERLVKLVNIQFAIVWTWPIYSFYSWDAYSPVEGGGRDLLMLLSSHTSHKILSGCKNKKNKIFWVFWQVFNFYTNIDCTKLQWVLKSFQNNNTTQNIHNYHFLRTRSFRQTSLKLFHFISRFYLQVYTITLKGTRLNDGGIEPSKIKFIGKIKTFYSFQFVLLIIFVVIFLLLLYYFRLKTK